MQINKKEIIIISKQQGIRAAITFYKMKYNVPIHIARMEVFSILKINIPDDNNS